MLFFRQLVISCRQPLDIALDLQQRERGQDPSRGQLGLVDQPVDRLIDETQLPAGRILSALTLLEVKGYVKRLPARYYELAKK